MQSPSSKNHLPNCPPNTFVMPSNYLFPRQSIDTQNNSQILEPLEQIKILDVHLRESSPSRTFTSITTQTIDENEVMD